MPRKVENVRATNADQCAAPPRDNFSCKCG